MSKKVTKELTEHKVYARLMLPDEPKAHLAVLEVDAYHAMHARQEAVMLARDAVDPDSIKIVAVAEVDGDDLVFDGNEVEDVEDMLKHVSRIYSWGTKGVERFPVEEMLDDRTARYDDWQGSKQSKEVKRLPAPSASKATSSTYSSYKVYETPLDDLMLAIIAENEVIEYDASNRRKAIVTGGE